MAIMDGWIESKVGNYGWMGVGEAEVVMEEVDNVAKVVERVATVAEKVSADVADKLPTNHTRLKEIALLIERVSELAAQDAQLTQDFIHKVFIFLGHIIYADIYNSIYTCLF